MNTARFYPRKTRFTPDSAPRTSRDLSAHPATTSATEPRRSHRKCDRNQRNSCTLAPDSPQHRKRPKLPKADSPTPARHISTASSRSQSYPIACHRLCNALTAFDIGTLLHRPQQLPTISAPIFARFRSFLPIIPTLSPPVAHHLLLIARSCAFHFVYCFDLCAFATIIFLAI